MANFSGLVKTLQEFPEGKIADDDYLIFGKASISKATFQAIKDAIFADTGWLSLPLSSGFSHVTNQPAQYRKNGNIVELRGAVKNDSNDVGGSTDQVTIGVLPEGFRPSKLLFEIHHAYNYHRYQMRVNTDGTVTVSRAISSYRTGGYTDIPAGGTIFLGATFIVSEE